MSLDSSTASASDVAGVGPSPCFGADATAGNLAISTAVQAL